MVWVDNSILEDQEQGHLSLNISLNLLYKLQEYTFFKLKNSVFIQVHKFWNLTLLFSSFFLLSNRNENAVLLTIAWI